MNTDSRVQLQQLIDELHGTVADLESLFALLSAPLDLLDLLPPRFRRFNTRPLSSGVNVSKYIPQIQRAIIAHILPTWDVLLAENDAMLLIEQYFCPDSFSNALPTAGQVAISAYATLVMYILPNTPQLSFVLYLLERLASEYPIDRLFTAVFAGTETKNPEKNSRWEDCVKNAMLIPAKVGNALGLSGKSDEVPSALENAGYFNHLSSRCETLIFQLSEAASMKRTFVEESLALSALAYVFNKLVNHGVFPPHHPVARSQPSFFESTLPFIRRRATSEVTASYSYFWSQLLLHLSSSIVLQAVLASLFAELRISDVIEFSTVDAPIYRARTRRAAALLEYLVGEITPESAELWEVCTTLMTSGREWHESYARVFVCWISGGSRSSMVNIGTLGAFFELVLDAWSSPEHIKHSLISRHRYTTLLFVLTASYFPPSTKYVQDLISNPNFIRAVSTYISHMDPSIRRCGMLGAEVVARLCGQKLDFGEWEDGDEHGKPWCRSLRRLATARDVDAEVEQCEDTGLDPESGETIALGVIPAVVDLVPEASPKTLSEELGGGDSDDSVTGYASPPSSRSPSPSPQELAELERDPTLNVGVKRVPKPVYLAQLAALLRGGSSQKPKVGSSSPHDADLITVALDSAEGLIRKKRGYGTELDENAANLAYTLLSLQDNYDLEGFLEKRQNALSALIACCPRRAAPCLIEEFFKNQYSVDQRFAALNALAMGARELASLPVPSELPSERTNFPSKMLPADLHRRYIDAEKENSRILRMVEEISNHALEKQRNATVETVPQVARERRLRIHRPHTVMEVQSIPVDPFMMTRDPTQKRHSTRFIDVASEFFIMPLINNFWAFMRDEQSREERTSGLEGRPSYRGAGTGLILNALVLSQFLRTLAILVHASQNAPEWLAVIAPNSLELAITLGVRPVSLTERQGEVDDQDVAKEASLITSALELALIVLDGALELDGGRTVCLENTELVLGLGDWASKVMTGLEKGFKVQGGGGLHENKLSRAAAGVLLKVDELTSKWRRSMSNLAL